MPRACPVPPPGGSSAQTDWQSQRQHEHHLSISLLLTPVTVAASPRCSVRAITWLGGHTVWEGRRFHVVGICCLRGTLCCHSPCFLISSSQRPREVGITLQLQKLGLRRLRDLPRSTQLAGGRAQTQTQGHQPPTHAGSALPAWSAQGLWSPETWSHVGLCTS